jgi:hypothetical protein
METPAERVAIARVTPAKHKPNKRRARVSVDKRFAIGKRIAQLAAVYAERAGLDASNPDPVLQAAVEKAALLTGLAEQASAGAARADPKVGLDDVVRLNRLADLVVRRLHLDQRRRPTAPSLSSYLAARG